MKRHIPRESKTINNAALATLTVTRRVKERVLEPLGDISEDEDPNDLLTDESSSNSATESEDESHLSQQKSRKHAFAWSGKRCGVSPKFPVFNVQHVDEAVAFEEEPYALFKTYHG